MPDLSDREATIYYLISRIYSLKNVRRGQGFSSKFILKVLYKLSRQLDKEDPIRKHLQYYWYLWGVFSDGVDACIKQASRYDWLQPHSRHYWMMTDNYPNIQLAEGTNAQQLDEQLQSILDTVDVFNSESIEAFYNSIYESDAPNDFTYLFGLKFRNMIGIDLPEEDFYDLVNNVISNRIGEYRALIRQCKRAIPKDPLFEEYRYIFYNYATTVERVLDYIENSDSADVRIFNNIRIITRDVWMGFVSGNRILDDCHDEEYDDKLDQWREEYNGRIEDLKESVETDYEFIFSVVKNDLKYDCPDDVSRKMLSAMVKSHITL